MIRQSLPSHCTTIDGQCTPSIVIHPIFAYRLCAKQNISSTSRLEVSNTRILPAVQVIIPPFLVFFLGYLDYLKFGIFAALLASLLYFSLLAFFHCLVPAMAKIRPFKDTESAWLTILASICTVYNVFSGLQVTIFRLEGHLNTLFTSSLVPTCYITKS